MTDHRPLADPLDNARFALGTIKLRRLAGAGIMGTLTVFIFLAALVVAAGIFLARFGDALGSLLGMGRTLAGMLLLALATSLPELFTAGSAAWMGAPDLATGNLVGSSLCNLLILAILDCRHRAEGRILSRRAFSASLTAMLSMLLSAVVALAIVLGEPWHAARVGFGVWLLLPAYLLGLHVIHRDGNNGSTGTDSQNDVHPPVKNMSTRQAAVGYLVCAAIILSAAPFLTRSAEQIAERSGLGDTFVGSVLLALATSLPELSTTWGAVRLGAFHLAAGNLFGSNAFNMVILLPVDALASGPLLSQVNDAHVTTLLSVLIITVTAVISMRARIEKRILGMEIDALLIMLLTLGSFGLLYVNK